MTISGHRRHPWANDGPWVLALSSSLILLIGGCGPGLPARPPLYHVEGVVLFQGKPLVKALVIFEPSESSPTTGPASARSTATGRTDEEGRFVLMTTKPGDGAAAGDYLVGIVSKPPSSIDKGLLSTIADPKARPAVDTLRGRYAEPKSSGLKATVEPRENTLPPFDLTERGDATPNRRR